MVKERLVTSWAFGYSIVFYITKRWMDPVFTDNIFEIATFALIIVSALTILANIYNLKLLYGPLLGLISFNTVYLGVLLSATKGLGSSGGDVIEGLTRVVVALCAIWKLSSDMRHLTLQIDPFTTQRTKLQELFYGILFPPREFLRLLKVLAYVAMSFYLVFSGLELLSHAPVNLQFFEETERISLNVLFFGVQTPMMMASRASISKTFSDYLQNLEWADATYGNQSGLDGAYRNVLNSNEISYDSISSNGKHIWFTILLMIIMQAYQTEILALDLFQIDFGSVVKSLLINIRQFLAQLF